MKFYITTPIYYVNDVPHIGHAYTTIACDILARWYRLNGFDVFFLTGTDEHGAKIAEAAQKSGQTPKELCDRVAQEFINAWKELKISNDNFIRTTDPQHEKSVQLFIDKLFKAGAIYKGKYEGLYCVQCEKFLSPGDLNEDMCCPDHRTKPVKQSEENYFFRLSSYRQALLDIITDKNNPNHMEIAPLERRNEIIGKLKTKLEDISISRESLQWGVPLPFDTKQTAYVWIDALLNYITGIGYENKDTFKKFWPADLHLMAKDILWFHSVIWPAMMLASGLKPPKKVFAHGFFTINGQKMSKTIGNVIRPDELIKRFGVDATRYLTLSLFPFGIDGDISWQSLKDKYNSDLANNLGNLVARTLTMLEKYSGGIIPAFNDSSNVESVKINGLIVPKITSNMLNQLTSAEIKLENLEFNDFINTIQSVINLANRFIEDSAPWKKAKEKDPNLPSILYTLAANLKILPMYILPFMPETSFKIWQQLGEYEDVDKIAKNFFKKKERNIKLVLPKKDTVIKKTAILFPRIQ